MLLTLFLLSLFQSPADALPILVPTNATSVPFASSLIPRDEQPAADSLCSCDCSRRTTYTIVQSCFFTIAACVYKAIHPNVSNPKASMWKSIWDRLVITFYTLLFSEFVMMWAIAQWYGARIVLDTFKPLGLEWTAVHGHFVQMGGFGRADNKNVLYYEELLELVQRGEIALESLQISGQDIEDHSKSNFLSKAVAALQTTWFAIQCVVRVAEGLILTEIEVVTLAFAMLNVIMYIAWWNKPQGVGSIIYLPISKPVIPPSLDVPVSPAALEIPSPPVDFSGRQSEPVDAVPTLCSKPAGSDPSPTPPLSSQPLDSASDAVVPINSAPRVSPAPPSRPPDPAELTSKATHEPFPASPPSSASPAPQSQPYNTGFTSVPTSPPLNQKWQNLWTILSQPFIPVIKYCVRGFKGTNSLSIRCKVIAFLIFWVTIAFPMIFVAELVFVSFCAVLCILFVVLACLLAVWCGFSTLVGNVQLSDSPTNIGEFLLLEQRSPYQVPRFYKVAKTNGVWQSGKQPAQGMILCCIFGAIHFFAWNTIFSSREHLLTWRIATVYITANPIAILFLVTIGMVIQIFWVKKNQLTRGGQILGAFVYGIFVFTYLAAHFAILVEALITLPNLPPEAFVDVNWIQLVPHL